jgi:hypothetical protein
VGGRFACPTRICGVGSLLNSDAPKPSRVRNVCAVVSLSISRHIIQRGAFCAPIEVGARDAVPWTSVHPEYSTTKGINA